MENNLVEVSINRKTFGSHLVFNGASLSIGANELLAMTGPSGSGKTTLLRILSGMDTDYEGDYKLKGVALEPSKRFKEMRRIASFVFQSIDLIDYLTVFENILLPFHYRKDTADNAYLKELVTTLGIDDKLNQKAGTLSLGERQRVAIARAYIVHPEIVFADEPTGSLDDQNTAKVVALLKERSRAANSSLFMVTHRLSLLSEFDRAFEIKDGKIQEFHR